MREGLRAFARRAAAVVAVGCGVVAGEGRGLDRRLSGSRGGCAVAVSSARYRGTDGSVFFVTVFAGRGPEAAAPAGVPACLVTAAASQGRPRGTGGFPQERQPVGGHCGGWSRADRDLVPGRGASRPARNALAGLGPQGPPATGPAPTPLRILLSVLRCMPGIQARRWACLQPGKYRRNEPASRRHYRRGRTRKPCCRRPRRRRMAQVQGSGYSRQPLSAASSTLQPGTEPDGKTSSST